VIHSQFPSGQPFNYPPLPQSIVENEALMGVLQSWYYYGYQTGLYDGYNRANNQINSSQHQYQTFKRRKCILLLLFQNIL